jgi:phospholipid/cholesterol/gamma-HCH transport system substrate-binding protein
MPTRTSHRTRNYTLIGSVVILVATIATVISFSATTGLPFVPRYKLTVELPDAGRLNVGAPVRVGGAQVGLVKAVHAVAPSKGHPSFARADLAIDPKLAPLPIDSTVRLRPISILGGKYISIDLGTSKRKLPDGKPLPLARSVKTVDIDQALRIFGPRTRRAIQGTVTGFGDALAGRGTSFGETIGAFDHMVVPLGRVADTLAAPSTRLPRFFDSGARLAAALAPVGTQLHGLVRHAGPTFGALRGTNGALGDLIEDTPRLERTVTPALAEIEPVLADAAVVSRNLGRGTKRLPQAVNAIDSSMRAAKTPLELSPDVAHRLQSVFVTLRGVAVDPATTGSLRILTDTVNIVVPLLQVVNPAQTTCNVLGLVIRNYAAVRGQGDANGSFARSSVGVDPSLSQQSGTSSDKLHYNAYPNEDASECEGGNEPYLPGRHAGNVAGKQPAQTEHTAPPKGAG